MKIPPPNETRKLTRCSFCGKPNTQTGRQVEGPSEVFICADCVDVAAQIVRVGREKGQIPKAEPE
jgi:ATP-dependent Clp protease ATP-binding subunit ClpX